MQYPSDKTFYRALLLALATHRDVVNAKVMYPQISSSSRPVSVPISNFRLNGGLELIEAGLTLAVYPSHASYNIKTGVPTTSKSTVAVYYSPTNLGSTLGYSSQDDAYQVAVTYRVVIQLFYRDSQFNASTPITYEAPLTIDKSKSHGEQLDLISTEYSPTRVSASRLEHTIKVITQPGEEVLREWMSILRGVVRDVQSIGNIYLGAPQICCVDYPTTNYIRNSENFVFHTAYMLVDYQMFEPGRLSDHIHYPFLSTNMDLV
jgi:hypothetical protein